MFLQLLEGGDFEGAFVGGAEDDRGRASGVVGLLPACGTDAPAVAGFQARKVVCGAGGSEVVTGLDREGEKLRRHLGANGMRSEVLLAGMTKPVPEKPGHRGITAGDQGLTQHVSLRAFHGGGKYHISASRAKGEDIDECCIGLTPLR
jgi:hypothetical protein